MGDMVSPKEDDRQGSLDDGRNGEVRDNGLLLSFEGIDASGKKTQSTLLMEWMRSKGIPSEYISFPDYSTVVGREITAFLSGARQYPVEAAHMLYAVNRLEHKKEISRWISEGKAVLINRYCDSNIAYGGASGLSLDWLRQLESGMPQADYVFYLKGTPALSVERKTKGRDRFEADAHYLERVSLIYDSLSENPNWFSVGADDRVESIHYEISRIAEQLLSERRGNSNKRARPEATVNTLAND